MKRKIAVLSTGWSYEYVFSVIKGMQKALVDKDTDIYLFLCYGYNGESKTFNKGEYNIFTLVNYEDYDGVVFLSNIFNSPVILEQERKRLVKSGKPAISLEYKIDKVEFIGINNFKGMYELIDHLITVHNTKKIAYIGGPNNNTESIERLSAYKAVLADHNIELEPDLVFDNGNWSYDFAYETTQKIIESKNIPDAIVCVNDEGALAAITSLYTQGFIVPDDIKVVGFDDIELAKAFTPSLTTVNKSWNELGKICIDHLFKQINGENHPSTITITSKPLFRYSCGCGTNISPHQQKYTMDSFYYHRIVLTFNNHLRQLEELFIENDTFDELTSEVQTFFQKNHSFEKNNFSILINDDFIINELDLEEKERRSIGYSKNMKIFFELNNGVSYPCTNISSRDLLPKEMISPENSLFLFLPLHYRIYSQGYCVFKNSLDLLSKRFCYEWLKALSNGLEKFRQKNSYSLINKKLTEISLKDQMTGLLNRFGYKQFVQKLFDENRDSGKATVIIFLDINSMKEINDNYGHLHGDLAIKTVAEVIQRVFPTEWLKIRYGGDEYVVFGTGNDKRKTMLLCKVLNQTLIDITENMSLPYKLSVSIGIKIINPKDEIDIKEAISQTDEIMYQQKKEFHQTDSKIF